MENDQEARQEPASSKAPEACVLEDDGHFDSAALAWAHVVGAFFLYFNSWGISSTFGVFQTFYGSAGSTLVTQASPTGVAWIGSTQSFLMSLTSAVAGPLYDHGYLRLVLLVGTLLVGMGQLSISFCNTYWQVFLAQGVAVGCGGGLLVLPAPSLLPMYFKTNLGLAVGIATAGSSTGAVVYPIVLAQLLASVGFRWATRSMAFIILGTLVLPNVVCRYRTKPLRARSILDRKSFADRSYMVFVTSSFVALSGCFAVWIWLSPFAKQFSDERMSFYVLAIYNAASCVGRIVPNIIADRIGPFNVIAMGSVIAAILILNMCAVESLAGLIVVTVLSGVTSGIYIGITPLCINALTDDKTRLGTRMGMGYAIFGSGVLIAGPGVGAILESFGWTPVWLFSGVMCFAGTVGYTVVRTMKYGTTMLQKA